MYLNLYAYETMIQFRTHRCYIQNEVIDERRKAKKATQLIFLYKASFN